MNTTTTRVARYVGAGFAGIAISCTLATPALAMRPDPIPGSGEQYSQPAGSRFGDKAVQDNYVNSPNHGTATTPAATTDDGYNWSALATGAGGGVILGGALVLGAKQARRRQVRPA